MMLRATGQLFGRPSFTKTIVWSFWLHCGALVTLCCLDLEKILRWEPDNPAGSRRIVVYSTTQPDEREDKLGSNFVLRELAVPDLPGLGLVVSELDSPALVFPKVTVPDLLVSDLAEPNSGFPDLPLSDLLIPNLPDPEPLPIPSRWEAFRTGAAAKTAAAKQFVSFVSSATRSPTTLSSIVRDDRQEIGSLMLRRPVYRRQTLKPAQPQTTESPRLTRRRSEISIVLQSSVAPAICPNPTTKADFSGIAAPSYPPEAIRRGIQGDVLVRLLVSDTGKVERVKVVQSSGHAILDNLVVAWLSDWHGKPARMQREPVWTYYKQRVRFRLN